MSGSQYHRRQAASRMPRVVSLLIVLAVVCVGLAGYAVFAPKRTTQPVTPTATTQQKTSVDSWDHQNEPASRGDSFQPRFPVSLTAVPERPATATAPSTDPQTSAEKTSPTAQAPLIIPQEHPTEDVTFPDLMAAKDFYALYRALGDDDQLAIHLAVNDFTTMPDDSEPLIRELVRAWTDRHAFLTNAVKSLSASVTLPSPITGQPVAIVSANRTGVMLNLGTASQQVPWSTWNRSEITRMWNRLAELQRYRGDSALIAVLANWLAQDMTTSRVVSRQIDKSLARDVNASDGMTTLNFLVERWLAMTWWQAQQEAMRTGDQTTLALMNTRLSALGRLQNPRIDTNTAKVLFSAPSATAMVAPAPGTVNDPLESRPLAGFPSTMIKGNWKPIATGARCTGAGSLVLADLDKAENVQVTFTPRQFRGSLSLSLPPYECVLNLDQSVMVIKGPGGTSSAIPVTVYPRHPNVLRLRFASKDERASLSFNHDPAFLEFPLSERPDHLRLAQPDGDLVINSITRIP